VTGKEKEALEHKIEEEQEQKVAISVSDIFFGFLQIL